MLWAREVAFTAMGCDRGAAHAQRLPYAGTFALRELLTTYPPTPEGRNFKGERPGVTSPSPWPPRASRHSPQPRWTLHASYSQRALHLLSILPPREWRPTRLRPPLHHDAQQQLPAGLHAGHACMPACPTKVARTTLTRTRVGLIASHDDEKQCLRVPRDWRRGRAPLQCPHGGRSGGGSCLTVRPSVLRTSLCGPEQGSGRDLTRLSQCTCVHCTRVVYKKVLKVAEWALKPCRCTACVLLRSARGQCPLSRALSVFLSVVNP